MRTMRFLSVIAALVGGLALPSTPVSADTAGGSTTRFQRANGMISVGDDFACAVNLIGELSCWGSMGPEQLGIGPSNTEALISPSPALEVPGDRAARSVSVGSDSACAVLVDGAVVCWGGNASGVLGTGDTDNLDAPSLPIALPSPGKALSVAVGEHHACALLSDYKVTCWGSNYDGELGNGTTSSNHAPGPPVTLPSPGTASAIEVSRSATCALLTDGKVTCWGRDSTEQLGNGAAGDQLAPPSPITLPSPGTATALAMGDYHSCALLTDGKVTCWGYDSSGELGNGGASSNDVPSPPAPITLPAPNTADSIAAGGESTCAVLTTGDVTCWGDAGNFQLGNGTTDQADAPLPPLTMPSGLEAAAVAIGLRSTCALLVNGRLSCWGSDRFGEVGNGDENGNQAAPSAATPVGGTGVAITVNSDVSCVLRANDNVYCWGSDWNEQMASGVLLGRFDTPRTDPIPFPLPTSVAQMVLAARTSCARLTDGTVRCWGDEISSSLGNGATGDLTSPGAAIALPAPSTAIDVSERRYHGCVVLTGGGVSCWGDNSDGQLGIGSTTEQNVPQPPVALPAPGTAQRVATGSYHTCALLTDGKVTCWGSGIYGQLGNNLFSDVTTPPLPVTLPAPGTATAISVGGSHSCALLTNGGVACWGLNGSGQLGVGDTSSRMVPTLVTLPSPGTAIAISAGEDTTCAILTDGKVTCWGDGRDGELGTGAFAKLTSPPAPITLPSPGTAVSVSVGEHHVCAVLSGQGRVSCWGDDLSGEIGDGAIDDDVQATPSSAFLVNGRIVALPDLLPVAPARLLETRGGSNVTIDGQFQGVGKIAAGGTLELQVGGRGGVATDSVSVGLNFTVVNPAANGFLTVYRCSQTRPVASNINFRAGQTIANLVVVRPDPDGSLCIYSSALTDLLVDVSSVIMPGSSYVPIEPARLLETRTGVGNDTVDGLFEGGGQRPAGSTLELDVGNRAGVPPGATAVIVNIGAVNPAANGFVTAYPCGVTRPTASNLNAQAGVTVSTAAVVELGTDDQICIYNSMATHLIVDVTVAIPAQTLFAPVTPARLLDTRSGPANVTIDGQFQGGGVGTAGSEIQLTVAGRGGIGAAAKTVSLTIVAIAPTSGGFITVYPCGTTRPTASNLNLVAGRTIANAVFAEVGDNGKVCIYRSAAVNLAVDVQGRLL